MRWLAFILLFMLTYSPLPGNERSIGLLLQPDYRGEVSFAFRIKAACQNIGWKADIININNPVELETTEYDFVISLTPGCYKHPKCKNYLAIFHPLHHYFKKNGFLSKNYRSFDGYLLTYSPNDFGKDKKDFADSHKFPAMQWYPTVQKLNYQIKDPMHLFHVGCSWGNRYWNKKFKQCLKLLDKRPYMRLYGHPLFRKLYPHSYKGEISFHDNRLHELSSQAGISLVLHSSEHNEYGVPSGRIFEATAAGTVVISDQNAFVRNNFGDSVLYINTDATGHSIFRQIHRHVKWIQANKSKALEMAGKAHSIYEDKFLLENQLLELERFHDRLLSKSKN